MIAPAGARNAAAPIAGPGSKPIHSSENPTTRMHTNPTGIAMKGNSSISNGAQRRRRWYEAISFLVNGCTGFNSSKQVCSDGSKLPGRL
jgi:hypothetical protein